MSLAQKPLHATAAEVWVASNVFAVLLWVLALGLLGLALASEAMLTRAVLGSGGALALWFGWRVSSQSATRRRIFVLLERRFERHGVRPVDLKNFLGEPCLQAQAFWILLRWRRLDVWREAMKCYWREDVLFFGHPQAAIEDELNFPSDPDR